MNQFPMKGICVSGAMADTTKHLVVRYGGGLKRVIGAIDCAEDELVDTLHALKSVGYTVFRVEEASNK